METTVEVLQRSWHVKGQSVRPDHRMVAHTGFLTAARLLSAGGEEPDEHVETVDATDEGEPFGGPAPPTP
jgi:tRNA (adenine57-N1/adenine58-N1)-methyltransferase